MVSKQTIISNLIREEREGTKELYAQIPFFMKSRLFAGIDNQPWVSVSEGCDRQDPNSIVMAKSLYDRLLQDMKEYIDKCKLKPMSDNSALMITDKNRIMAEFGDDAVRFVKAMAECVEMEKKLVFMYHGSHSAEGQDTGEVIQDVADEPVDIQLQELEQWKLYAEQQLNAFNIRYGELIQAQNLTGNLSEIIGSGNYSAEEVTDHTMLDIFRWKGAEIETQESNEQQLKHSVQQTEEEAMNALLNIKIHLEVLVKLLGEKVEEWKAAEAKRSVKVGPETDVTRLMKRFQSFGKVLSTVLSWFRGDGLTKNLHDKQVKASQGTMPVVPQLLNLHNAFKTIEEEFFKINFIVTMQPKGVISIENKGSKKDPNYCTKKTQPFSTTIRILSGEHFEHFHINDAKIDLISEKDLATGSFQAVVGKDKKSCLKVELSDRLNSHPEVTFNVEVKNFCRLEQNNVYKQFFRILYQVSVTVSDKVFELQTLSLPFTFNTGANQILEHMGARMWYCANCPDLYKSFQCPDPLPVDKVIDMLDARVTYLDSKRKRRLSDHEKEFLRDRLQGARDSQISMQGFLKDKIRKVRTTDEASQYLQFSFYTWFYAVVHCIESLLLDAWLDGIIYGFCSEAKAKEILMKPDVPEGACILRPSTAHVKNTSSADATAAIIMEVKRRNENSNVYDTHELQFEVISVPLMYKTIEDNTLYGAVKGIECDGAPVAKLLYGRDGTGKELRTLKGYVKKPADEVFEDYQIMLEKIEKFNLKHNNRSTAARDLSEERDNSGNEPTRRKRKFQRSQSSVSSQGNPMSHGSSSSSTNVEDSMTSSSGVPDFNMLQVKQEIPPVETPSGSMAESQFQGQRSGLGGSKLPDCIDMTDDDDQPSQALDNKTQAASGFMPFGSVLIDTSGIHTPFVSEREVILNPTGSPVTSMDDQSSLESSVNGGIISTQYSATSNPGSNNTEYTLTPLQNVLQGTSWKNGLHVNMNSAFNKSPGQNCAVNVEDSLMSPPRSNNGVTYASGSESCPSPADSSCTMSPYQQPMQSPDNLPTVLNDADLKEPRRPTRRRSGRSGNAGKSNTRQKSPASSQPVSWIPVTDQNGNASLSANTQNEINTSVPGLGTYTGHAKVITTPVLNWDTCIIPGDETLREAITFLEDLGVAQERSPSDSGYSGEQTPSPDTLERNPLSSYSPVS